MRSTRPYDIAIAFPLLIILLASAGLSAQKSGKKVALVIGNSAYRSVQALRNPANDAADMAAALSRMGFTVLSKTDLDRKAMRGLIDDFNKAIQGADIALFFYSGHGVQLDGENYLVPVNAEVAVASDVPDECVSLSRITGRMNEAGTKTNVIFLDACRDNPFKAVSRGIERGLAVMGQKPPESVIIYATAENEKAEDGSGRNGTFTAALLKNIESRESLTDILFKVKDQVRMATGGKQRPALYENMTHSLYLSGNKAATATASSAKPTAAATSEAAAPKVIRDNSQSGTSRLLADKWNITEGSCKINGDGSIQFNQGNATVWYSVPYTHKLSFECHVRLGNLSNSGNITTHDFRVNIGSDSANNTVGKGSYIQCLIPWGGGDSRIDLFDNSTIKHLLAGRPYIEDSTIKLKVEVDSDIVRIYINDQMFIAYGDNNLNQHTINYFGFSSLRGTIISEIKNFEMQ